MSYNQNRREERRKMRDEWRAKFSEHGPFMSSGIIRSKHSGIYTGIFIMLIGIALLAKSMNIDLPFWLFTSHTFLIALGFFIGLRRGFRGAAWFILMLIGGLLLYGDIVPDVEVRRFIWPAALIVFGAFLIIRPRRSYNWQWPDDEKKNSDSSLINEENVNNESKNSADDFVDCTSIFGGTEKNIFSKNFKGGDIVCIFGGTELDLSRADFTGTAVIEITAIFGGAKLIVPSHWIVKSEAAVIFGGIEDKRSMPSNINDTTKTLILKGTIVFGGVDIRSY
jgi:predicted membrane protein